MNALSNNITKHLMMTQNAVHLHQKNQKTTASTEIYSLVSATENIYYIRIYRYIDFKDMFCLL